MKKFCLIVFSFSILALFAPLFERLASSSSTAFSVSAQTRRQIKKNRGKTVSQSKKLPRKTAKNSQVPAAENLPVVTRIDFEGLQNIIKRNGENSRPLLVNFWATWCDPCQEEFPELVKIDGEFRPRGLDFVTISLDDLAEIKRDVPRFLAKMKAEMPAFLLKSSDEEAAIAVVAPGWTGGFPLTVLYNADGKIAYSKTGMIKPEILRAEIEKVLQNKETTGVSKN